MPCPCRAGANPARPAFGTTDQRCAMKRAKWAVGMAAAGVLAACGGAEPERRDTAQPPAAAPMPVNEDISRDASDAGDPGDVGGVPDPAQVPDTDRDGVPNVRDTTLLP